MTNKTKGFLEIEILPNDIDDPLEIAGYFGFGRKNTKYITIHFLQRNRIHSLSSKTLYSAKSDNSEEILADFYYYETNLEGITLVNSRESDINKDLLLEIVAAAHGKKLN